MAVFDQCPEAGVVASLCDFIDYERPKAARLGAMATDPAIAVRALCPRRHDVPPLRLRPGRRLSARKRILGGSGPRHQDVDVGAGPGRPRTALPGPLVGDEYARRVESRLKLEHGGGQYVPLDRPDGDAHSFHEPFKTAQQGRWQGRSKGLHLLGSQSLWAGGRPRFFRRLLKRSRLGLDFNTVSALVWTAWASLSPGSLRAFLRSLLFVRNYHASMVLKGRNPVVWTAAMPTTRSASATALSERPARAFDGRTLPKSASAFSPPRHRSK